MSGVIQRQRVGTTSQEIASIQDISFYRSIDRRELYSLQWYADDVGEERRDHFKALTFLERVRSQLFLARVKVQVLYTELIKKATLCNRDTCPCDSC